jgi:2-haloacid dehalogenase
VTDTVAFDVIGTMFSLERVRHEITSRGAPPHALDLWFVESLRDYFSISHSGAYEPLANVLRATLPRSFATAGVNASEEDVAAITGAFRELEPVDGVGEACDEFIEAGWRLVTLTNGSEELTGALLERAGLTRHFSAMLSCDSIRISKPHPDVYAMARKEATGSLWLLASHAWDVAGAKRAGLRAAFVGTDGVYPSVFPGPDVIEPDLPSAARSILAH